MKIIKTSGYKKDFQKKIKNKHKKNEEEIINKIEELLIQSNNMKELMINPLSVVYNIEKKNRKFKRNIYCKNQSKIKNLYKTSRRISI